MHTFSNTRTAEGLLTRAVLITWAAFEFIAAFAGYALMVVLSWQERARQRRTLASLDDRLLRDIGIGRADVDRELRKQFWQI
jgi:uncharacterized protein YjiS (DUF1127 family)